MFITVNQKKQTKLYLLYDSKYKFEKVQSNLSDRSI